MNSEMISWKGCPYIAFARCSGIHTVLCFQYWRHAYFCSKCVRIWILLYFGMWHHALWQIFVTVLKECAG